MHPITTRKTGLVVLALVSVGDALSPLVPQGDDGPPLWISLLSAALGLASLWLIVRAWIDPGARVRLLVALRVLSAITALPAFVVSGISAGLQAQAAAIVLLTACGCLLVARRVPAEVQA